MRIKDVIKMLISKTGYNLVSAQTYQLYFSFSNDMDQEFKLIYDNIKPYTMTSIQRAYGLYKAVEYIIKADIKGDFIECGVWKGGSSMVIAYTLNKHLISNRFLWLYDTYEGMVKPMEKDKTILGEDARHRWATEDKWNYASIDEVERNMTKTNYPLNRIKFIKGKVEDTIPDQIPDKIALLRLDTDFYNSTLHELKHLFPRLVKGGVILVDDYGHWQGQREAVDKYFTDNNVNILLNRIDYTGRIGIK